MASRPGDLAKDKRRSTAKRRTKAVSFYPSSGRLRPAGQETWRRTSAEVPPTGGRRRLVFIHHLAGYGQQARRLGEGQAPKSRQAADEGG